MTLLLAILIIIVTFAVCLFMLEALILLIIKRKATKDTELTKTIGFSRDDWFYIIPSIGFSKTSKYFEVESTWLGYCIYVAYKFDKIV